MREPTPRASRFAIAGALVAALLLAGGGFWLGRTTSPAPRALVMPPPQASSVRSETPAATRTLGRFELAALAAEAADALASGIAPSTALADSVGRRVDLLLPFGCDGPAPADSAAPLRWRYDQAAGALRVHVAPTRWAPADWGLAADTGGLRGFWIARPWATGDRCPTAAGSAVATDAQPVTLPGQTLAVALVGNAAPAADDAGTATDATSEAGTRVFEIVRRIAADAVPTAGLRLRLTGRLGRLPAGDPLRCVQPAGIEQRPLCLVALNADELRIEDAATGAVLGAWPLAGTDA